VTEEATKSRALRRNLALWLVAAVLLGIVSGYLGGSPPGSLWRIFGGAITFGLVFSCLKALPPWRLPAAVIFVHCLTAIAAYNVIPKA
jgi:hypothetical protein